MKKSAVLKTVSCLFALTALLAAVCAFTVTGGGFLDLSNIVRAVCLGAAVACAVLAVAAWKSAGTGD